MSSHFFKVVVFHHVHHKHWINKYWTIAPRRNFRLGSWEPHTHTPISHPTPYPWLRLCFSLKTPYSTCAVNYHWIHGQLHHYSYLNIAYSRRAFPLPGLPVLMNTSQYFSSTQRHFCIEKEPAKINSLKQGANKTTKGNLLKQKRQSPFVELQWDLYLWADRFFTFLCPSINDYETNANINMGITNAFLAKVWVENMGSGNSDHQQCVCDFIITISESPSMQHYWRHNLTGLWLNPQHTKIVRLSKQSITHYFWI